ncbi:MAG: hypothetical protein FJW27_19630 [Acidimicrobiia bacterium]|nr:hypothetical protein [Acidimicrobiia bacterium]
MRATSPTIGAWETFTIESSGGGVIRHGEPIALRTSSGAFVVAENGGDGNVMANGTFRAAWETFTLLYVTPHGSDVAAPGLPLGRAASENIP